MWFDRIQPLRLNGLRWNFRRYEWIVRCEVWHSGPPGSEKGGNLFFLFFPIIHFNLKKSSWNEPTNWIFSPSYPYPFFILFLMPFFLFLLLLLFCFFLLLLHLLFLPLPTSYSHYSSSYSPVVLYCSFPFYTDCCFPILPMIEEALQFLLSRGSTGHGNKNDRD